jgi:hypothetical protein
MPMAEDHRVPALSNREIREEASKTKHDYGAANRRPVNIVRFLESGSILTKRGRRKLVYNVVDDHEMGDCDGRTDFRADTVTITVKRSVHERAVWGDGRARMTLAHELGHGVLHYGAPMFRGTNASGPTELSQTSAFESAEHQAKVFASAFLIDDKVAATFDSAEQISVEFGVSLEAAEICFERLAEASERVESAKRVMRSNEEYQAVMRSPTSALKYLGDVCGVCGNPTLVPMGVKLMCNSCGTISDWK